MFPFYKTVNVLFWLRYLLAQSDFFETFTDLLSAIRNDRNKTLNSCTCLYGDNRENPMPNTSPHCLTVVHSETRRPCIISCCITIVIILKSFQGLYIISNMAHLFSIFWFQEKCPQSSQEYFCLWTIALASR